MTNPDTLDLDALEKIAKGASFEVWTLKPNEEGGNVQTITSIPVLALIKAAREREELQTKVYVPGLWKCVNCGFTLVQSVLRASDGAVGVRDEAGEHCPNDGAPLWRVTERDAGNDLADRAQEYLQRAVTAETELGAARAERDEARTETDMLFDALDEHEGAEAKNFMQKWLNCKHSELAAKSELATARAYLRQAVKALEPFATAPYNVFVSAFDHDQVGLAERVVASYQRARDCRASLAAALGDQPPAPASTEEGK